MMKKGSRIIEVEKIIETIYLIQSVFFKRNFTFGFQVTDIILSTASFLSSFVISILFLYKGNYEDASDSMDECRKEQDEILQDFLIFWLIFVGLGVIEMIVHGFHAAFYVGPTAFILYLMGSGESFL